VIYAEDLNYWKSGQSSPDTWIDRAKREIVAAGGKVISEAYGKDEMGRAAFLLEFTFAGERFKAIWPVLKSRAGNEKAARIQAATCLFHDVKHRCVLVKVFGAKQAFFNYLLLPDGRTAGQAAAPELLNFYPKLLTDGSDR
jgi:hypothetical protein